VATRLKFKQGTVQSQWLWAVPFFLPALFFQSSLFAFISPLPFFVSALKNRTWIAVLSVITNASILFAIEKNLSTLALPIWYWLSIGISFPLFIRATKRVPSAFFASFTLSISVLLAGINFVANQNHLNLVDYTRAIVSSNVDQLLTIPDHPIKKWIEEQGRSEMIHNLMLELPSGILIAIILCYWFNLLLAFRTIPGFLSRAFWGSYKNPEWLIWPTLITGFLYAYSDHALFYIGMNGMKIFLLFYGFQGLSIVTYVLNQKQIYGLMRPLIYGLIIFIASPFAFALGFFDQWFDFRRKFGQS
jgi:hypothetical protein